MSEVKVPIELLERILTWAPGREGGAGRDEIQAILDAETRRREGWRGGRPKGKTVDLTGFERDGAKVLGVDGDACSILCACGSVFSKGRRRITDKSTKLRCQDCFKKDQREKAVALGTIFTGKPAGTKQ